MRKIDKATDPAQKFQLTTDGLKAYSTAIGNVLGHQGERVDYAQLVKIYKLDIPEDQRRYSPPRLAEAIPTPIYGEPDEAKICTSHVERQNFTIRMWRRRLTRSDKRVLQEVEQSSRGAGPALRVVQLLPKAHHAKRRYCLTFGVHSNPCLPCLLLFQRL
jgi:hypothetical protein